MTAARPYAVIGGGYMGGGIAQVFALAGHDVRISDVSADAARDARERLIREAAAFAADDLFPPDADAVIAERLSAADSIADAVAGAAVIEEAVPEVPDVKLPTLREIGATAEPDALIGSNTSTIAIGVLAEAVARPERFLGIHFSNPAPFIPGVELIPHAGTAPDAVERARELVASVGRESAVVADVTGFVLNRLQYALFHEATQLVEEGVASADDIDTLVRTTFGFRLPFFGPFAVADMAGLDVYANCYTSLQTSFPERFATPAVLRDLVDEGRIGTKAGGGFLRTPAERIPDLVAYRNRAYVRMSQLIDELGPAPLE
ncbi:3-hydroxyacyl-CoA dehydrogenase family protein [Microbacterium sp.]|uniref:3-hydroxyacyl-CoA dehydrogenase family protein n=1 Tax=Microbacterium sp. TaxID=51671 RepID=UPI003A8A6C7B